MNEDEIVRLKNIGVSYGDIPVLEDITLSIFKHDFLGIIGPNGGGKSTLLKVILGLVKPYSGAVSVFGKSPEQVRSRVGYVSQRPNFDYDFPASVRDVVMMGCYGKTGLFRRYNHEDNIMAEQALFRVGMQDYSNKQIGKLSGGQQKRVFIARALVAKPELLILE